MIKESAVFTNVGKVRELNEDSFLDPNIAGGIFAVADGMGGHNAGEVASKIAVSTMQERAAALTDEEKTLEGIKEFFRKTIEAMNKEVRKKARANLKMSGMGTTFVGCAEVEGKLVFVNVGDSRGYLIRDGKAIQVTKDHSLVQQWCDLGIITEEEMETHPNRNVITRAIGSEKTVECDIFTYELEDGDIVLLCSDGLSGYVDPKLMVGDMWNLPSDKIVDFLGSLALDGGGQDNITAVLCKFGKADEQ